MSKKSISTLALLFLVLFVFSSALSGCSAISSADTVPCFSPSPEARALSYSTTNTPTAQVMRRTSAEPTAVYPGGMPFGVKFLTEGVLIVGFCDVQAAGKACNPSLEAGLRQGDLILKINDGELSGASELNEKVENSGGQPLRVLFSRDGTQQITTLKPVYSDAEGRYKSGLYVRDSGAGIGTVTFILPDSYAFGGLGHGICDAETGELIPMRRGSVVGVTINGVVKGLAGAPGEVKGYFSSGKTGTLLNNTDCGVFGILTALPKDCSTELIPIGKRDTLTEGKAHILCTLDDTTSKQYEVEICNIQRDSTTNKCFTVKVTDAELISKTGGIIQGMSGSPIIQNGKLVGAVTHVLINDPTTGYGIFIENMLTQMGELAA